jgi:hypothetical protein
VPYANGSCTRYLHNIVAFSEPLFSWYVWFDIDHHRLSISDKATFDSIIKTVVEDTTDESSLRWIADNAHTATVSYTSSDFLQEDEPLHGE